jgi:hypothetical protein
MELSRWLIVAAMVATSTSAQAETVAEVFKRVADSVVVIRTSEREAPDVPGSAATSEAGLGSGVLIDKDRVLTAAHVVQVADTVSVQLAGGETLSAKVVASVPSADLALIQLERAPMKASIATLGDSDKVQVGDEVLVIGAPLGMSHTLSVGHISGRRAEAHGGFAGFELPQPMPRSTETPVSGIRRGGQRRGVSATSSSARRAPADRRASNARSAALSARRLDGHGGPLEGDLARVFQLPQARGVMVQRIATGCCRGIGQAEIAGEDRAGIRGRGRHPRGPGHPSPLDAPARIGDIASVVPAPISLIVLRGGRRLELEWTPPTR